MRLFAKLVLVVALCLPFMGMGCPRNNITPVDTGPGGPEIRLVENEGPSGELMKEFQMRDESWDVWLDAEKVPGGWKLSERGERQFKAMGACENKCKAQFPGTSSSCKRKFKACMQSCADRS